MIVTTTCRILKIEQILSFCNINITQTDVKDILSSLIVNKASGSDGISHRMLKKYLSYYS